MKSRKWPKLFAAVYLSLAGACFIVIKVLKAGGYYDESVVSMLKYLFLGTAGFYIFCIGISNLRRYKKRYPERSIKGGSTLLLLYTAAAALLLVLFFPGNTMLQKNKKQAFYISVSV